MIYTEMTRKAINVAYRAHDGQKDRAGWPYVVHPIMVAEQMTSEDACVVALLHDVVEDTDVTMEELRAEGFTDTQLRAVQLLTRDKFEPYMDYVARVAEDPLAKEVKLADLRHNMDRTRLSEFTAKDEERYRKYKNAEEYLLKD
ncbi:MAG: GTP pyrophosphokinase [Eubacterium sp.]|nr:GTP pyrophosphokinase [Eubacterium sp.]